MKKRSIESKVDKLIRRKKFRRMKQIYKNGLLAMIFVSLLMIVVSGSLFYLYGSYTGEMDGSLSLSGISPHLAVDGVSIESQTFPMTLQTTSLYIGDVVTEEHTITAMEKNWKVTWDISNVIFENPDSEFYGYGLEMQDILGNPVTKIKVYAGNTETLKMEHSLDSMFKDTSNPLPFSINLFFNEMLYPFGTEQMIWEFEDDLTDQSGNAFDGIKNGGIYTVGKNGGALQLNDGHFAEEVTGIVGDWDVTDSYSISMYLYLTELPIAEGQIINKVDETSLIGWRLAIRPTGVLHYCHTSTGYNKFDGGTVLNVGQWYHVVATYDGTGYYGMKLYLDKVEETKNNFDNTGDSGSMLNTNNMHIGATAKASHVETGIIIDDLAIYDGIVLTPQQISDIYAELN